MPSARIGMDASLIVARSIVQPSYPTMTLLRENPSLVRSYEEVPPEFRYGDHHSGLPDQPLVIWPVIHDPDAPGDGPFYVGEKFSTKYEAKVAKSLIRVHLDLSFAVLVLGKTSHVDEKPGSETQCEIRTLILIPANKTALRSLVSLSRIESIFECLCWLCLRSILAVLRQGRLTVVRGRVRGRRFLLLGVRMVFREADDRKQ